MSAEISTEKQNLIKQTSQSAAEIKKPGVLFVWNYLEWGGGQIYFLGIMRLLLAKNYAVRAVMPRGTSEKLLGYFRRENVPTGFFDARVDLSKAENFKQKLRRRWRDVGSYLTLAQYLSKVNLSDKIIHTDIAPWSGCSLLFYLALQTHVFVALHIALKVSPIRAFLVKQKFRLVCALPKFHIIASNHDVKNSLREFVPEKKWREIPIAYTGVNTSEIKTALAQNLKRDVLLEKFGIPKNRLLVFSLANIIERKGFRVLLEAAKQFKNENLFFVWIGDGENRQEMQRLITELGLENNVGILRPAEIGDDRQDLLQVLRLADIFVHPSFAEGLPGAMLEAMALGKAVVASAVNAIPEAIENGENGFLVEAGDAAGIAQAISLLANDSALRKEFGKKAQERVLNSFTEENCAEITIEHYKTFWQNASSKKK